MHYVTPVTLLRTVTPCYGGLILRSQRECVGQKVRPTRAENSVRVVTCYFFVIQGKRDLYVTWGRLVDFTIVAVFAVGCLSL